MFQGKGGEIMYLTKYLKPYKWQAISGFIFKLIEAFLELCIPMAVALIIDNGVAVHNTAYITKMAFVIFGLSTVGYCSSLVCQYFASLTSQGVGTLMRKDMYRAINRYDYQDLDIIGTPSLITRITNDINQIQLAVAMAIRLCSRSPFLIIGSLVMSFIINWQVALIFVVVAPLIAFSIYFIMSHTAPMYSHIQKILDKVSLITRENLSGVRVIRAFNQQNNEEKRFEETTTKQKEEQITAGNLSAILNPATTIIVNFGIIAILYISGIKINVGTMTQGEVISLINYMNQILLSMYVFANVIVILNKAGASYKRCKEVLQQKPNIVQGIDEAPAEYKDMITYDHVSFSYYSGNALKDVSFNVLPGKTIGIIGGTGSGKTTLINLIPRFYDVSAGEIRIKDIPIKNYKFEDLRNMIGIVPQQATLFGGTIRENMLWGNPHATDEEIYQALEISQSKEFVDKMSEGLDTYIEQGGKNVSGGQRQRLTIARALVKKPEILILDDSASALDFATDAKLRKALRNLDMTVIIVSQRVSALMHADSIVVLSHGEVAGEGTHDTLMNNCEIYKEIVMSQMEGGQTDEK